MAIGIATTREDDAGQDFWLEKNPETEGTCVKFCNGGLLKVHMCLLSVNCLLSVHRARFHAGPGGCGQIQAQLTRISCLASSQAGWEKRGRKHLLPLD